MLQSGSVAPNIEAGGESLYDLLQSGPVLVVFFKVSCPTCQFTFPFLQRFADAGLPVIGISQDGDAATDAFRDRLGLRFPLWKDPAAGRYRASNAYKITHVPSLFLVGNDRKIGYAIEGFSKKDLEDLGATFDFVPFAAGEAIPAFKPG